MTDPFVSVIVPVRNEETFLGATLRSLLSQRYPADCFEVIVADGQSEDGTVAIVRRLQVDHPNLRLVDNPRRLSSAARNLGVRQARGEFILIVDGHCDLRNANYLADMVEVFERHGVESVGRPQPLDVTGASTLQQAIAVARSSRLGHNPGSFIYADEGGFVPPQSVAIAYRRDVFDRIGMFDETFDACEDVELNTRLAAVGGRCYFAPKLSVRYYPRSSLLGLARQMVRYGRGRAKLLLKHPRTFSVPSLVPAAFLLALIGSLVVGLAVAKSAIAFCLIAGAYCTALIVAAGFLTAQKRQPVLFPLLPAVFASIHFGAGWGVLVEFCARLVGIGRRHAPVDSPITILKFRTTAVGVNSVRSPIVPLNALTFDIEEYFQVTGFAGSVSPAHWDLYEPRAQRSTDELLEMLARTGVRATFFILGWLAKRRPSLVRRIAAAGHEVASHGYWHQLVTTQTRDEFRADVRAAKTVLEDILGQAVVGYRAPSFSIAPDRAWAFDVLVEEGYEFDSSVAAGRRSSCGHLAADSRPFIMNTVSGPLREYPLPTVRVLGKSIPVGGGGYFRLMPYAATHRALRNLNAVGNPFCVYLHPWEIDVDQPRLRVPLSKSFRHRVNLHRTQQRLEHLLADFRFDTVSASMNQHLPTSPPAAAGGAGPRKQAA